MNALAIGVTVVLLALNAFFVAAEFALVAARRSAIESQARSGTRRATATIAAMEQLTLMLAGAQLGVTICSVALGAVSEPAFVHLIEPVFDSLGLPSGAVHPVAFALALGIVTGLHVVLGELVPKNATLAKPTETALWLAPALAAVVRIARPLIWTMNAASNLLLRLIRVTPRSEIASTVNRTELASAVEESHREGLLDADERDLLSNAINWESATAADVMVPLQRVHTIAPGPSTENVERLAAATGVTRFPVLDDRATPDLVGYIHLRDVLSARSSQRRTPLPADIVRSLPSVPADQLLSDTIEMFREERSHIARVSDPADTARTLGVVTLDDILTSLTA